jgi:hypothetical protein
MAAPVPIHIGVQPTSSHPAPKPAAKPAAKAPSPLLNPAQSLSGQALLNAANQLANVQVNPALTELSKQIAANNAQTTGTINQAGGFYNQLEPYVQAGANQQGQIASGLNTTLAGIGNDTQGQLAGIGQGAQASLAKYAPQGDGGLSNAATADLAAQIARQQGYAAQQSGTARAFGATQGANYQGLGTSQLGTYGLQGQEALKGIAQSGTVKNEPLVSKIAGLQQQKGALVATDLGKLRQQEVANNVARAGLGLKQQGLNTTAANDAARIQTAIRGQNVTRADAIARINATAAQTAAKNALTARGQNITQARDQANAAYHSALLNKKYGSTAAAKPLSASQNNEFMRQLQTAIGVIHSAQAYRGTKDKPLPHGHSEQDIKASLGAKYHVPDGEISAQHWSAWWHVQRRSDQGGASAEQCPGGIRQHRPEQADGVIHARRRWKGAAPARPEVHSPAAAISAPAPKRRRDRLACGESLPAIAARPVPQASRRV